MKIRKLLLIGVATVALALPAGMAQADDGHSRPAVCSVDAGQVDEAGFGSRDGFDHFHVTNPAVFASLADLEGFLNNCHTNLNVQATGTAKNVSASARAIRISGVNRVQLRARLRRWAADADPVTVGDQPGWVVLVSSPSVNTGDNRTLLVTTPLLTETSSPAFVEGWYDVNVRAQVRYSNRSIPFYQFYTYAVWLGDGPAVPATPPAA